jgi:hypothetical protein
VGLWGDHGPAGTSGDGLTVDEAIDLITTSGVQVLVAERHGQLVGVAIGAVTGPLGVIHRVSGDEQATDRLLEELEVVLAELGARKLIARAHPAQPLSDRLLRRGFRPAEDVTICEREVPATTAGPRAVSELGGQLVSPGLWQQLEAWSRPSGSSSVESSCPWRNQLWPPATASRLLERSCCSALRARARPPSPKVWRRDWAGPSFRSSRRS